MIPQRQPQLQGSHDSLNYQSQQRPKNLLGEVYFDFRNGQYKLLHSHESINPLSVIYHESQDQCYYFGRNQTWKSAMLADLPDSTAYYMYKSGPLQQPNWPEMSHSLMTPSPTASPPLSPHVSFPPSAF